jgi:hypothetical protein
VVSAHWKKFMDQEKPASDQAAGDGTVYYLPALLNGVQAPDGSDTIIYATDNILMFAKAGVIVKSAEWTKLLNSMTKTPPQ